MTCLYQIAFFVLIGFTLLACNAVSPINTVYSPNAPLKTHTSFVTATIFPTSTETVIFETPTFQPEIAAEVATLDAIVTDLPELRKFYDRFCITHGNCAFVPNLGLSPNGKWAVFFTVTDSAGLSIVNVNNNKQWHISYHDITGTYGGDATVVIEHWSQDGNYLYVSPRTAGSGGLGYFWRSETQLIQLDLTDGTWRNTNMGSAFSFSPDDNFIAYRREQNVVIHEFQTSQEKIFTVPLEYGAFGRFVWSQDNKQIMFIGSSVEELEAVALTDDMKGFTLFLLDTEKMDVQVFLNKDERYLYPLEWKTPKIILLESLYKVDSNGYLHYNGEQYKLDLASNEILKNESP